MNTYNSTHQRTSTEQTIFPGLGIGNIDQIACKSAGGSNPFRTILFPKDTLLIFSFSKRSWKVHIASCFFIRSCALHERCIKIWSATKFRRCIVGICKVGMLLLCLYHIKRPSSRHDLRYRRICYTTCTYDVHGKGIYRLTILVTYGSSNLVIV